MNNIQAPAEWAEFHIRLAERAAEDGRLLMVSIPGPVSLVLYLKNITERCFSLLGKSVMQPA